MGREEEVREVGRTKPNTHKREVTPLEERGGVSQPIWLDNQLASRE